MYPEARVDRLVRENFLPVRVQVRSNPALMERFGVQWTPTILLLDASGKERHRIEGYLDAEGFLSQLTLGLAHIEFASKRWDQASRWYSEVLERYPTSDAAAEAQYWRGVTRYKATNDAAALAETARAFGERYSESSWAKKASIWK